MSYIFWKLLVQRLILAINQVFWSILRGVRILLTHCNRIVHKIWHHVLTSFVFPRPFDPRWIRIHLTSLKLSLFLFYIPRHVVCCDCNGIGWIATRLVWLYDRMILLRKFSVICLCPPIVSDPVGWRLKYTEVQSQWMAFTQSPSLSNSPKILNNYLIFFISTVQRLWIFVVCSVIETTFIGERGFRFIRSGMPIGNGPLSISSTLA